MDLHRIFNIARWELQRDSGFISRETLVLAVVAVALVGGVVAVMGVSPPDEDLYVVGVASDSPYHDAFDAHDPLRVVPPDEGRFASGAIDVYVTADGDIYAADTATGRAAAHELTSAVQQHNTRLMGTERDVSAAFPVAVTVEYVTPEGQDVSLSGGDLTDGVDESPDDSESVDEGSVPDTGDTTPDTGTGDLPTETDASGSDGELGERLGLDEEETIPADLVPPLPFESLLVAFALLVPLNFIAQVYASSMIAERTKRRGEMLLVSPASRYEIVIGKTLPYFGIATLVTALGLFAVEASWVSVVGVIPLTLAFLALALISSSFARSYKELSFFTLGVSVLLTTFAFIPAIFTQVHPISAISPLSVVVSDLQGMPFDEVRFLMGAVPLLITSAIVFVFCIETYEEEFLFAQASLPEKLYLMLSAQIQSPRSLFVLGALSLPFVFIAELLVLAGLIAVPQLISIPLLLGVIALIEEIGKSLPVYAAFRTGKVTPTWKLAIGAGGLAGFGFFAAEKLTVITQQVGITGLTLGEVAFSTALVAGNSGSPLGIVILVLWPFLHSITTAISCIGARYGRGGYIIGLALATFVHVGYNIATLILHV